MSRPSMLDQADLLIGIDDTDNVSSHGTGFLVQHLILVLEEAGEGRCLGATRHQLLVHPAIRYTSHNSSACISWCAGGSPDVTRITALCARVLEEESAEGSDPGLVVARRPVWTAPERSRELVEFGRRAQREVLDTGAAWRVAASSGVHASVHGGDGGGVIGALAAVGLHASGADGFFLWMPGIRAIEGQRTYAELRAGIPIDSARDLAGREPSEGDAIELGDWVRPVWRDGQAVLLLQPHTAGWSSGPLKAAWRTATREVIRRQ
ncbi:MAG TPA: hypothetical protein VHA57_06380 [Actinomycetota bacterium]|nr:hypothetical protein [Actinomycetota bacterium]